MHDDDADLGLIGIVGAVVAIFIVAGFTIFGVVPFVGSLALIAVVGVPIVVIVGGCIAAVTTQGGRIALGAAAVAAPVLMLLAWNPAAAILLLPVVFIVGIIGWGTAMTRLGQHIDERSHDNPFDYVQADQPPQVPPPSQSGRQPSSEEAWREWCRKNVGE